MGWWSGGLSGILPEMARGTMVKGSHFSEGYARLKKKKKKMRVLITQCTDSGRVEYQVPYPKCPNGQTVVKKKKIKKMRVMTQVRDGGPVDCQVFFTKWPKGKIVERCTLF